MPKKSFPVGGSVGEPVEFELNGTDAEGQVIKPITFRCKPHLQGVEVVRIFQDDAVAAGKESIELIGRAIVPEQKQLWEEVTTSDRVFVTLETLGEIAMYLIEVYTANPTSGPRASSPGVPPTGPTSMADYLSRPEPTLHPSPPIVSATPPTP